MENTIDKKTLLYYANQCAKELANKDDIRKDAKNIISSIKTYALNTKKIEHIKKYLNTTPVFYGRKNIKNWDKVTKMLSKYIEKLNTPTEAALFLGYLKRELGY